MRTINIGKLNKRITILRLGEVEDEFGQLKQGLQEMKTVWGTLTPVRGSESYEIQKIKSKITHKCYVRYLPGIDSNNYLRCNGITYNVESAVDVDLEHKLLEIYCSEQINQEVMADE